MTLMGIHLIAAHESGASSIFGLDPRVGRGRKLRSVDDLVTIGTFSMLTGLSVTALRHYDDIGLLEPEAVDASTGYRRYSRRQLEPAWLIAELRAVDLPLDEVRAVLEAGRSSGVRRDVLAAHLDRLRARGREVEAMADHTDRLIDEGDKQMQGVTTAEDVRLVAVNIGVSSAEELAAAAAFWEAVLDVTLEDWGGGGVSRQARVGREDHAFFFNLRVRSADEPHHGHRAAFGLAVADLDAALSRAMEAGAVQHYPPTASEEQPRHSLIEDPVGNRVVLWQG
jgi:DNA-binding transcriptional MerR regulator